jgi:hypothetical protein
MPFMHALLLVDECRGLREPALLYLDLLLRLS